MTVESILIPFLGGARGGSERVENVEKVDKLKR
jgi:hypothetical protein